MSLILNLAGFVNSNILIWIRDRQSLIILKCPFRPMASNELDQTSGDDSVDLSTPTPGEGRRSLLQIKVDILKVVASGFGKPTQIMYRANLSWNVLQAQLKSFVGSGMLDVEEYGSRRRYLVTPKGMEMLDSYQKVVKEILN